MGVVDLKRKKGRKVASTLQSSSGGILRVCVKVKFE